MANVKSKKLFTTKIALILLNVLVLLGLAGFGGYFFKKYQDTKSASPEQVQKAQTDEYIAAVGKLYALPKDETPSVGKVSDKEAIKKQYPVLDQVENDDVLLIYQKAKVALLYRPSTGQLIKVIPITIENAQSIRVVGSEAERAAVEKILTDTKLAFTSGGAAKTQLSGITVVDLKGSNSEQAKKLAEIVKGTVGTLPAGEEKPGDVDLLILVGPTTPSVTP